MQVKPSRSRDIRFDLLRVVGIFGIVASHAIGEIGENSQNLIEIFIKQIRNFDVPLMVIISGSVFYYSYYGKQYSFLSYLKKRIPRLIIPVWFCLLIFFVLTYLTSLTQDKEQEFTFSFKEIIVNFLLLNDTSIGYIWIIRVFILVAIVAPLLFKLQQYLSNWLKFMLLLAIIYSAYEIVYGLIMSSNMEDVNFSNNLIINFICDKLIIYWFLQQICFYLIPYGCLFGLGMIIIKIKNSSILAISIFAGIVYLIVGLNYSINAGHFVSTYIAKYPPRIYYVSYGIFMSTLMYLLVDFFLKRWHCLNCNNASIKKWTKKVIFFISFSSLWIYLWHLPLIYHGELIFGELDIYDQALGRFLLWLTISIFMTYFQKKLISHIVTTTQLGQKYSTALSIIFLK